MFEVTKLSMSSASSKRENYNNLKQPIKYHRRMPKPVNCMRSDISVISAVYWGQSLWRGALASHTRPKTVLQLSAGRVALPRGALRCYFWENFGNLYANMCIFEHSHCKKAFTQTASPTKGVLRCHQRAIFESLYANLYSQSILIEKRLLHLFHLASNTCFMLAPARAATWGNWPWHPAARQQMTPPRFGAYRLGRRYGRTGTLFKYMFPIVIVIKTITATIATVRRRIMNNIKRNFAQ